MLQSITTCESPFGFAGSLVPVGGHWSNLGSADIFKSPVIEPGAETGSALRCLLIVQAVREPTLPPKRAQFDFQKAHRRSCRSIQPARLLAASGRHVHPAPASSC